MKTNIIFSILTFIFGLRLILFLLPLGYTPNAFPYSYYTNGLIDLLWTSILIASSIAILLNQRIGFLTGLIALIFLSKLCFHFCAIELDWILNPSKIHRYRKLSHPDLLIWMLVFPYFIIKNMISLKHLVVRKCKEIGEV